jgi:hypothetical protein
MAPALLPQTVAANCLTGWGFPWGVRVRLAERLLLAMFDSLDESQYVDEWVARGWLAGQMPRGAGWVLQAWLHSLAAGRCRLAPGPGCLMPRREATGGRF